MLLWIGEETDIEEIGLDSACVLEVGAWVCVLNFLCFQNFVPPPSFRYIVQIYRLRVVLSQVSEQRVDLTSELQMSSMGINGIIVRLPHP